VDKCNCIVGLALNLRAYDFVSQELRAAEDPEFEPISNMESAREPDEVRLHIERHL
jgi:hypothetical protein